MKVDCDCDCDRDRDRDIDVDHNYQYSPQSRVCRKMPSAVLDNDDEAAAPMAKRQKLTNGNGLQRDASRIFAPFRVRKLSSQSPCWLEI